MKIEPLVWPENWPRCSRPRAASFDGDRTVHQAARALIEELSARSGPHRQPFAHSVEVTVADGSASPRRGVDQGAAVWFTRAVPVNGNPGAFKHARYCLACDAWDSAAHNLWALKLHVASIRGQERWGVGEADRALAGYRALPPSPNGKPYEPPRARPKKPRRIVVEPTWVTVLDLSNAFHAGDLDSELVHTVHRELVKQHHPDRGGSSEVVATINAARDEALAWLDGLGSPTHCDEEGA